MILQETKTARESQAPRLAAVGVIGKVLRIFETMRASSAPLHLRELCQQTRINKTTAYRFLSHLEREGYVFRDEAGRYSFGMKLLLLGAQVDQRSALREMARPFLRELWEATGETVNLAVLDAGEVLYLDVIESPHIFRLASKAGMRRMIYSTALGKSLAAFLPPEQKRDVLGLQKLEALTPNSITSLPRLEEELERVRRRGYAVDDEESVLGARCVGAPVLNRLDQAIAAISASGPTTRINRDQVPDIAKKLKRVCQSISTRIGL